MKRAFSSFTAIALVSAMATAAMGQSRMGVPQPLPTVFPGGPGGFTSEPAVPPNYGPAPSFGGCGHGHGHPVARFDRGYLDKHPEVAGQLASNPALVDNQQFLAAHPDLEKYLAKHPDIRANLEQHPERFMAAESRFEHHEGGSGFRRRRRGWNPGRLAREGCTAGAASRPPFNY
jgi:hypothetical protein